MRFLSLTVRNYRIHRDLTIAFDPSRNLIGGPNETGKSTLAEALHRVLFLRHRVGGEVQRSMKSDIHPGHPEVRLVFHAHHHTWTVEKRFSGPSGTILLTSDHGDSLTHDEAEEKLAELTGTTAGPATRLNDLTTRWSHLWVWQGTAGENPATHAAQRRDELVQRLQQQGLAAVMQSATDERARQAIQRSHDEIFTPTGAVRANSRLDLATRALAESTTNHTSASKRKEQLAAAIDAQEAATKALAESLAALPAKRNELAATQAALAKAAELRSRQDREQLVLTTAATTRGNLLTADRQIRDFQSQAATARQALVPANEKLAELTHQESTARQAAAAAETAHRELSQTVRLARQHHDLAAACLARFEKANAHDLLTAKAREIAEIEASLAADRTALSQLPSITPAQLESLRKLQSQVAQAESALTAIATGIELIASDQAVLLDSQPLTPGHPQIITGPAELTLADGTHLRIQPGGGTSLADARRNLEALQQELAKSVDQLAIRSPAEAAEILTQRQVIENRIASTTTRLQALGARELPDALAAATTALTAATAEVDRRLATLQPTENPTLPTTLETARTWLAESREALQNTESREHSLLAESDARRAAHLAHLRNLQSHQESLETARKSLETLENSARILEQNHGDATQRSTAIAAATAAEAEAKTTLATTTHTLAQLNPDNLQHEATRLSRVITIEEEKQRDAETRIAVARTTLALDGSSDPEAELLHAKARLAEATDTHAREQRNADAIALLQRLFAESQSAISESLTLPIADRVSSYLECLFGRGVRVKVDLSSPADASLHLTRPGSPTFDFSALSGGAREQVAAALRLATAEILATQHDGCLPIIFDDAFAYADDFRIQSLQSMLDLAATRGLQIIVLTCTPAAYIGLGARETRLPTTADP